MKKIGIIGRGFVGSAVEFGFSAQCGCNAIIKSYDIDESRKKDSLDETVNNSDFIFVSVPTPSNHSGIDLSFLMSALKSIEHVNRRNDNVILIRSTIIPGTTKKLDEIFKNLNIVFNPEFLTERSAKFDFINQSRFVIGGDPKFTRMVAQLYKWRFGNTAPIIQTNFETAELIKYMNNCFFATKVSFLNEMKILSQKIGADWETSIQGFVSDGRIGHSHTQVPGPDGKLGFGGNCLPKDVKAILEFSKKLGINLSTIKGAWETNLDVRPKEDLKNYLN
ncbi:MAG: hypothetical protein CMP68_02600 [Flavobacteriales bacterium]|nr:hypothetical protein [Flavobacteriales bacterium]|tara:strand:+ start:2858 stop:3691 length:834 start_codon:yes stop_codon:yes gene_type:complete